MSWLNDICDSIGDAIENPIDATASIAAKIITAPVTIPAKGVELVEKTVEKIGDEIDEVMK